MRKFFFFLIFIIVAGNQVQSQQRIGKNELEINKKTIGDHPVLLPEDTDFQNVGMGEKWPGESAVILSQKTKFGFDRKGMTVGKRIGRNVWGLIFAPFTLGTSLILANSSSETKILIEESERRKLLLRDKYAIEQYSVLYFRIDREGDAFAAQIIKKDGTVEKVDLAEAIQVEDLSSIPSVFKSYTDNGFSAAYRPNYYKIAVPGLEEGDMLEYEFRNYNVRQYQGRPDYKEFDPVYFICNRELPVSRQVIEVATEDDRYYIGYKSNKGAPDFEQITKDGKKTYRWEDRDREKNKDTRYVNEFTEQPSIKFQIIYARNNSKKFIWFGDEADMKRDITNDELAQKAKTFWFNPDKLQGAGAYTTPYGSNESVASSLYKTMKKKGITDASDDEFIRKAYYMLRSKTMYRNWSDYAYAKVFSYLLTYKKIDHEIVVTTYNTRTSMQRVAFTQELAWVIKCKNKYYVNPDNHLNPDEIPIYIAGNPTIRFNYLSEKSPITADQINATDTSQNKVVYDFTASLDASGSNMVIEKTTESKGMLKADMMEDVLALTPFIETDFRNYDGEGMWEGFDSRSEEKAVEEFNKQKKEWKEEKPKMMKELIANEFDFKVENYSNFKLIQDGRSYKKPGLKYSENFTLGDMIASAGDDKIIALPALLGGQTKITRDERSRSLPIDVRYARTLQWNIRFTIPAGYTVIGLEELQKSVSNICGSFKSVATVEGNTLVLQVSKIYNAKHFESSQWNLLLQVLDQSYNYSQAKVVLKKS